MVRVVKLSKGEILELGQINKLERITKKLLPQARVMSGASNIDIYIEEEFVLLVYKDLNENVLINVYQSHALENAIKLAQAYENAGESEITVNKRYRD